MNLRSIALTLYDTLTPWRTWYSFWRIGHRRRLRVRIIFASRYTVIALAYSWRVALRGKP